MGKSTNTSNSNRNFKRNILSARMVMLTVVSCALSIICIGLLRYNTYKIMDSYKVIVDKDYTNLEYMDNLREEIYVHQSLVFRHFLKDTKERNFSGALRRTENIIKTNMTAFESNVNGTKYESAYHDIYSDITSYLSSATTAIDFYDSGDTATATFYMDAALSTSVTNINTKIDVMSVKIKKDVTSKKAYMNSLIRTTREMIVICLAILIAVTVISIFLHTRLSMELINTDAFTGLYNFEKFIDIGDKLKKKGILNKYNLLSLNIKDFKYINEEYNSLNGDIVLKRYSEHIMSLLNKGEYAARNGADNFYVLLGKDTTDAFIGAINPLAINADGELTINVYSRFGIFSIDDTTDIKESVSSALLAMNQARILKQTDIVWYNESSKQDMLHSMEIIAAFDDALKNDEFQVYYQPKVDLFKNRMCGAEALVRWIRDGRIMPPDEFIPVLEKENLITRLDFYVLTRVCMDLRGWLDAGLDPVTISSNFSKEHLSNPRFAEDVLEVLEHYFIPHDLIQAELTESSGYEDYNALNTFVSKMRDEGISTAMDDFGTGYSSLSLLRDINMDVIKLDRSFLRNIDMDDVKDEKMIANIVKMLHDLDKRVICEGIETEKQANYLRSINCHEAQGYLYGKPMPKKEFEKLSKLSRF